MGCFKLCVYSLLNHVWVCVHALLSAGPHVVQQRVVDPPKLELQAIVTCLMQVLGWNQRGNKLKAFHTKRKEEAYTC